ncbi:MAG: hypothetical protein JSV66_06635 [Trueperaceae bacterium]|nr:MAG: hypothetical protein JSV66_06635 [Trueperaceae bacterium]
MAYNPETIRNYFDALGNEEELEGLDEPAWEAFLKWELHVCRQPGAVDGGSHMLAVATCPI